MSPASLLMPGIRWTEGRGFADAWDGIEKALHLGVGGFILFGGEAASVRQLIGELRSRSRIPLLIAADLERGAGQQFSGATPLPPAAALGWLGDAGTTERAGRLTALEAREIGVDWVFAPVADVDLEPLNPIVGTRSFGTDPVAVAAHVASWTRGCGSAGVLSCAKHFPGHGRTTSDSHLEKPIVPATLAELEADLLPFRAAVAAGVDSVMAAHVAYPALDASSLPATLSAPILSLLRDGLGFRGLIVTDALDMAGFGDPADEAGAAVRAMRAGCDILLCPREPAAVVGRLENLGSNDRVLASRIEVSVERRAAAFSRLAPRRSLPADADSRPNRRLPGPGPVPSVGRPEARAWALEIARRSIFTLRGSPVLSAGRVNLLEFGDEESSVESSVRARLARHLRDAGVEIAPDGSPVLVVSSTVRAGKGRSGLPPAVLHAYHNTLSASPSAPVILFGHPRLATALEPAPHVLIAWAPEPLMLEAAVLRLVEEARERR